jgi:D-arabinonate dehydratase/D-galactarolactone cycloisomerase
MKIAAVEAIPVRARMAAGDVYWGNQSWGYNKPAKTNAAGLAIDDDRTGYPPHWRSRAAYSRTVDVTIVKITTDTGLVGWGEAKAPVAPEVTATIVRELMTDLLIGHDPTDRALHWDRLYGAMRIRGHSQGFWLEAMSGIDIALWDITGKALGVPVSKLLGGTFRRRVKIYASGIPGVRADAPAAAWDHLRALAAEVVRRGFRAVKVGIGLGVEGDVRTIETLREAFGPDFAILTDAAGMYDLPRAIQLARALHKLQVGWLEAPLPPEAVEDYARLAQAVDLPIASDLVYNRWQVKNLLLAGGVDVVQPDVCRAGGLTEAKRIAELADAYHKAATPHVSIGSAIQFAASVHLAASLPNQTLMEFWYGGNPLGDPLRKTPFRIEDGYFWVPETPGLGADIDEDALRQWAV